MTTASNGKTKIIVVLVVTIFGITGAVMAYSYSTVLPKMTDSIIANDVKNTEEHKDIRSEISAFSVEQMRQGTILERIDKRLDVR